MSSTSFKAVGKVLGTHGIFRVIVIQALLFLSTHWIIPNPCSLEDLEGGSPQTQHFYNLNPSLPLFTILYFNARSVFPKLDELVSLVDIHTPDIICIVESWLDKDIADSEISIADYASLRLDRDRHGGGVLIYLKSSFCFSTLPNPTSGIELLIIVIQYDILPARICLSVFYRPPSSGPESLDAVCDYFNSINSAQFTNFVLIDDFNVDVSTCSHPLFHKLISLASTYCLSQMVIQHTHIYHNGSRSTIDLLFVSNPNLVKDCYTIPPLSNSDHLGLQINYVKNHPNQFSKGVLSGDISLPIGTGLVNSLTLLIGPH